MSPIFFRNGLTAYNINTTYTTDNKILYMELWKLPVLEIAITAARIHHAATSLKASAVTIGDTTTATTATLTSIGSGNEDSGSISYTVTLPSGSAPQGDQHFDVTLSNNQVIEVIVKAGALSGTTTVAWGSATTSNTVPLSGYPNSDVYKEADYSLTASKIEANGNGGNYEELQVINKASAVTIGDTITVTTATLTSIGIGNEDSGSISYTVTLPSGSAPQGDQHFDVTLSNNQVIDVIVKAGELSGTTTLS